MTDHHVMFRLNDNFFKNDKMSDFFVTYTDWIVDKLLDGENIDDILLSGYTGSSETYYCPDCAQYVLALKESFITYVEGIGGYSGYSGCCLSVYATIENYLSYCESSGGCPVTPCCITDKFCLESNLGPDYLLPFIQNGVYELSNTSEVNKSNLCYLLTQLNDNFDIVDVITYLSSILSNGIVIWCSDGNIYAETIGNYLIFIGAPE